MQKNDLVNLKIDALTLDGQGIGRLDGLAVFVPGTAPGDEVLARIVKTKKRYARARLESLEKISPDRQANDCPAYPQCGGCSLRHITYEAELKIKAEHVEDCFKRIGHIDIEPQPIRHGPELRYRNKAGYQLEAVGEGLKIGFYAKNSHRVADCRDCLLQPGSFEAIVNVFVEWIKKHEISIYKMKEHKGLLRHIYIRQAPRTGQIMVYPVINANQLPFADELIQALLKAEAKIKSIVLNINRQKTNIILGSKSLTLWGSDYISDSLCGLNFRISPQSFYQVNSKMAEVLYEKAAHYAGLTGQETVLDLYCGAGTIGLSMADKAKEIIGVESVPQAVEDAKINAEINNIQNAKFICADAAQAAERLKAEGTRPDVIILDPPRKGCAPELLKTVADLAPKRIVYVSCDPATLARDCAVLSELDYETLELTPVDMFPRTGHVETVVSLSQKKAETHININVEFGYEDGQISIDRMAKRLKKVDIIKENL